MIEINKQYWWSGTENFGDLIGPEISNWILNKKLILARGGDENVLLGPGSIIDYCDKFKNPIVWGTGIDPHYGKRPKNMGQIKFLAVRGHSTREFLNIKVDAIGDPGLLLPELYPKAPTPDKGKISIIVHHSTLKRRKRDFLFDPFRTKYHIISPLQNYKTVVDEICSSEFCFCQSLHGAILAHAYGVPWAWWKGFHGQLATFKWKDWFSSIEAEPKSFLLRDVKNAAKWSSRTKFKTPDLNALKQVLKENVK